MGASLSSSSSIGASSSSLSSSRGLLTPCGPGDSAVSGSFLIGAGALGLGGMLDGGALKMDF